MKTRSERPPAVSPAPRYRLFSPPSPLIQWRLYGALITLWLVVVTLKAAIPDEIEHAHVAWLMYERGLAPIRDFFQHHTPLLWDVLGIYYASGGDGPQVLYFGRALVLLSGAATIAALHYIGRPTPHSTSGLLFNGGMAGALFFLAPTTIIAPLFIARPETLGTALFFAGYLSWLGSWKTKARRALLFAALAGALFGLANLASPRFLLLAGVFLLSVDDHRAPVVFDWKRLAALAAGGLGTGMAYLAATDTTLTDIHYILSFSAMLQDVGDSTTSSSVLLYGTLFALIGLLVSGVVYRCTQRDLRRHLIVDLAYLAMVILLSFMAAGKFVYAQDMSPVFVLGSLLLARGYRRIEVRYEPRTLLFGSTLALLALLLITSIHSNLFLATEPTEGRKRVNLVSHMKLIERDLDFLPSDGRVLLTPRNHPIAADDATYYWRPLPDSDDRLCRAIDAAQATWPLPDCDFLEVLENERPYLLTKALWSFGTGEDLERIETFVQRHYLECGRYFVLKDPPDIRCPDGS